jgi:hypothetical protein
MPTIGSWQEYLVNMALPYEKGNVEGGRFYLQWLSIIFRVNIQVWSTLPDDSVHSWCTDSNYDQTIDIISLKTDTPHIHYQPLMGSTTGSGSTVHATQTASNVHTRSMLFNENETCPSCDEAIQGLNKKHRLTYHNLKKVIRETHPSCDQAIEGLNKKRRLTYHNLKKVIRERKKYIDGMGNTTGSGSSVNAIQTTSNLHKHPMLFNQNETHPSCHEVIFPLNKKCRLSYHNLKKVIRERKKYITTLPSRQKLTYHKLKKIVRAQHKRNMYGHISHNGDGTVREEKITFRGLEPTTCTTTNENQQTLSMHTSLRKKDARQTYVKQIKDTPSIACAICNQLNFAKNTKSFTPDLEEEYLRLTENDKTFSSDKICLPCKRSLENGKLPQFATPDQIRCNTPLLDVSALIELEERLVSL